MGEVAPLVGGSAHCNLTHAEMITDVQVKLTHLLK